jgi:hypothetical protein
MVAYGLKFKKNSVNFIFDGRYIINFEICKFEIKKNKTFLLWEKVVSVAPLIKKLSMLIIITIIIINRKIICINFIFESK